MDIVTYILCKSSDKKIMDYVKAMERLTMVVQDTVPTVETAEPNKLYLVDTNHDGTYEEYVLAEISGEQQIIPLGNITDLDNYFTKPETMTMINTLVKEVSQKNNGDIRVAKYNNTETTIPVDQAPVDGSLHLISSDAVYDAVSSVHISLTAAEYDALTPAQKINGSEYFVYDSATGLGEIYRNDIKYGTGTLDAINVIYDNTTSALTATNVQDALDEVVENIDGLFNVLTKAQYDALTPVQQNDGTIYFVVLDANSGEIYKDGKLFGTTTAVHISYDNTTSGLSATDVQEAIDEIVDDIKNVHVDLTQAQYDALPAAEKVNGTEYFITDAVAEGDFSNLETRLQKMESNFIDVSANVTMPNPVNYKSMTKVNDNKVEIIIEDTVAHKDYKVTVTANGSGNTRTNPQYTIEEVI